MKKLLPLLIAVVILGMFAEGYSGNNIRTIKENCAKLTYYNTDARNFCIEAMDALINEDSILVMGSSELSASDNVGYPPALFNKGNSDYNMIMMGRGTMQSLHHAISLGALADSIENKKAVLILSPQWFTASHLSPEAYASRFSERLFSGMVKNKDLSYETKRKLADRAESLLETGNPEEYKRVLLYDKVYIEKNANLAETAQVAAWDVITDIKQQKDLLKEISEIEYNPREESVAAETIDYAQLLENAEAAGVEACTNNSLYIYDDYFTTYVEPNLDYKKDLDKESSYLESPEYGDLELFLMVCQETGIHSLVVSIPVNGIWYDWTGFPQENRQAYYQKIRDICFDHDVSMLDFSDREYEHYFLKDIMHLGWKGWVYLDEAVYRYYLDKDINRDYPFEVTATIQQDGDTAAIRINNHLSDVNSAEIQTENGTILLKLSSDGYLSGTCDLNSFRKDEIDMTAFGTYGANAVCRVYVGK